VIGVQFADPIGRDQRRRNFIQAFLVFKKTTKNWLLMCGVVQVGQISESDDA